MDIVIEISLFALLAYGFIGSCLQAAVQPPRAVWSSETEKL